MKSAEMKRGRISVTGSVCLGLVLILLTVACSRRSSSLSEGGSDPSDVTDGQRLSGDATVDITAQGMNQVCEDAKTESFPIQASYRGLLDILVVLDSNTVTSARREQAAERMRPLINKISASDYQVAIISGDREACVGTIITKDTPNAGEVLVSAIKLVPPGPGGEFAYSNMKAITGLTGVKFAKRNDHSVTDIGMCSNTWLRDDSVVAIIVISDNTHLCCWPYACTMIDIEANLRKVGRLGNSASQRRLYRLYGLLDQGYEYTSEPPDHTVGDNWYVDWRDFEEYTISGTTTRLADFVKSIDDPNYDDIFNNIANDLATSLGDIFTLAEIHDNNCASVSLTTNGTAQALSESEYEISGKTLKIKRVLTTADTKVDISYSY